MSVLHNIVQNILIIIMLATLLEMLLPNGDMRRYVRLIMGLFIIMVVLHPVLSLFNSGINYDAVSFNGNQPDGDFAAAVAKGRQLGAEQKTRTMAGLQDKINGQVMALARLNKTVNVTGVEVDMVDDPESDKFGQIKNIIVQTGPVKKTPDSTKSPAGIAVNSPQTGGGTGVHEVGPVEIDVPEINAARQPDKPEAPADYRDSGRLREILADFYGIAPEQVKIIRQP